MKKILALILLALVVTACATHQEEFKKARIEVEQGKEEEGLARLEQAIKESPNDAELRNYYLRHRAVAVQNWLAMGENALGAGQFDVAHLFYAHFRSALVQEPVDQQIIPVPVAPAPAPTSASAAAVEYEPDEEEILADLLPRNVAVQIFRALLENAASEQGSRMTAMDNATRNAGDMINRLTIQYNRTRQAAITKELIEIISGAEAL